MGEPMVLNGREKIFVKKLAQGNNIKDSAIIAGYSQSSAYVQGSRLLRKAKIVAALERKGITDSFIASKLKSHIDDGMGIKPSADTSLRAIELSARLMGHLDPEDKPGNVTQNNTYINELRVLDDSALTTKLDALMSELETLKK